MGPCGFGQLSIAFFVPFFCGLDILATTSLIGIDAIKCFTTK